MARPQLTDSTSFNNCSSQIRNLNPTFPCIAFRIKASPFLPMQGLFLGSHSVNGALTALNLSSNDLKDEGVSAVCEAIQSNKETKLASLDFGNNGIHPVGANAVAAMVAVTGGLTKLSLAENNLGEEGTKAICEALEKNETLKELDLRGGYPSFNNIGGAAGVKHVAKMLGVNGALTQVIAF